MERKGARNRYTCEKCGEHVITENTFDLVTPFMVGCRVTPGCDGMMTSGFYPNELNGWSTSIATTHRWVAFTDEQIEKFRRDGDDEMVAWATGDHGDLVEAD